MVLNKISIVSNYNNITNKDCIEDSKDTGNRNKGIKYILEIRGIEYGLSIIRKIVYYFFRREI